MTNEQILRWAHGIDITVPPVNATDDQTREYVGAVAISRVHTKLMLRGIPVNKAMKFIHSMRFVK